MFRETTCIKNDKIRKNFLLWINFVFKDRVEKWVIEN